MVPWTAHGRMKSAPADLGDRISPSWTAGRSQGFMGNPGRSQTCSWRPGRSQACSWTAVWSPPLLRGRPLCCLVALFAVLSPPFQSGRPICSLVAPYEVWSPLMLSGHHLCSVVPLMLLLCLRNTHEGCTLPPRVHHVCHDIIEYFWV